MIAYRLVAFGGQLSSSIRYWHEDRAPLEMRVPFSLPLLASKEQQDVTSIRIANFRLNGEEMWGKKKVFLYRMEGFDGCGRGDEALSS